MIYTNFYTLLSDILDNGPDTYSQVFGFDDETLHLSWTTKDKEFKIFIDNIVNYYFQAEDIIEIDRFMKPLFTLREINIYNFAISFKDSITKFNNMKAFI